MPGRVLGTKTPDGCRKHCVLEALPPKKLANNRCECAHDAVRDDACKATIMLSFTEKVPMIILGTEKGV